MQETSKFNGTYEIGFFKSSNQKIYFTQNATSTDIHFKQEVVYGLFQNDNLYIYRSNNK